MNINNGTTDPPKLIAPDPDQINDPTDKSFRILETWSRQTVAPYVPYTPVLGGTSGGFAYGTGAYQIGRFKRIGPQVYVEILIYFGNPGFVAGGATTWNISLPIIPQLADLPIDWSTKMLGSVFLEAGAGLNQDMHAAMADQTAAITERRFYVLLSGQPSGTKLTGTVPAKAQGALLFANLTYECVQT